MAAFGGERVDVGTVGHCDHDLGDKIISYDDGYRLNIEDWHQKNPPNRKARRAQEAQERKRLKRLKK